jgi:hypothetical protein
MAANLTGALPGVQRANTLTGCADDPVVFCRWFDIGVRRGNIF